MDFNQGDQKPFTAEAPGLNASGLITILMREVCLTFLTILKLLALPILAILLLDLYSNSLCQKNARNEANLRAAEASIQTLTISLADQYVELKKPKTSLTPCALPGRRKTGNMSGLRKMILKLASGLIPAFLMLSLISRAKTLEFLPCSPPPAIRLQDVPEPVFRGQTNEDLIRYIQDLRAPLRQSNLAKAAFRLFYEPVQQ
jgi:hypothetical protein